MEQMDGRMDATPLHYAYRNRRGQRYNLIEYERRQQSRAIRSQFVVQPTVSKRRRRRGRKHASLSSAVCF